MVDFIALPSFLKNALDVAMEIKHFNIAQRGLF